MVTLDSVPSWSDTELYPTPPHILACAMSSLGPLADPLTSPSSPPKFPVDPDINSKLHLWHGEPWNLDVDAVVNSSDETLSVKESSPGLHAAAGPNLAQECANLGGCRTGAAQATGAYDLPARRVIHTVGPKYVAKYHSAAENALSHCYRSCLELLIEEGLQSIAFGCIYTEAKGYPREEAAHVALRTLRRFLEKYRNRITSVVFCLSAPSDIEIYRRLLMLYFPRNNFEEDNALLNLPAEVGDENGGATIFERKIRITALPGLSDTAAEPTSFVSKDLNLPICTMRRFGSRESLVDPSFLSMTEDPDQRREEQWERVTEAQSAWNWPSWRGQVNHGSPTLEEASLHARYLARANAVNLSQVAEMKILYHGGSDIEGRQVMVVVGAHFLLRCLDLDQFLLYVVKEFEDIIHRPFTIVYFHSAAALQLMPDMRWIRRMHQSLGHKHKTNLQEIYMVHPTLSLKATVMLLALFVDSEVWNKVVYVNSLLQLFKYVPQDQLKIPDFVFQHDVEVNGEKVSPQVAH